MGDVAMIIPVIRELIKQNPQLEVFVVSKKTYKGLFQSLSNVTFFGVDFNGKHKGLQGLLRLSRELQALRVDAVADLHNVLRSNILRFFMGSKNWKIVNKARKEKRALTRQKNKVLKPLKCIPERYADVFRALNINLELSHSLQNHLSISPQINGGIGIAPFAAFPGKTYPIEKMKNIAISLAKKGENVYLFGGGSKEVAILTKWSRAHENIESLAGKFSLNEELSYLAGLDLLLCMDSSNMHLASLVGTRCLSIWGATHPFAGFMGYGQNIHDAIQRSDLACRPCSVYGNKDCEVCQRDCLYIEEVVILQKVKKALQ